MRAPDPTLLRTRDLHDALHVVGDIADTFDDAARFARCGIERLPQLAASELTTLSLCDLGSGHRHVIGAPGISIDADARASFDRHFHEHPLVRFHGFEGGRVAQRISDCPDGAAFRRSALYRDYYRTIGIDHALALPVFIGGGWLVSFVFNRRGRDFGDRERALLDQVRPSLAALFNRARLLRSLCDSRADPATTVPPAATQGLSAREREVLHWVAQGKTDRDIGDILGISPRTVHKHLQRVYDKLGVETRTAAVMRVLKPY